jgi:hypothetical protein
MDWGEVSGGRGASDGRGAGGLQGTENGRAWRGNRARREVITAGRGALGLFPLIQPDK